MPIKTTDTAKAEELQKAGRRVISLKGINPTEVTFETEEEEKERIAAETARKEKQLADDKKAHDDAVKAKEKAAEEAAKAKEKADAEAAKAAKTGKK